MPRRHTRLDRKTRIILTEVRDALRELYGARLRKVCLYGSYARGDQRDGSDMDVLFVLDEMRDWGEELERVGELGSRLSLDHDITISFCPVDEWEFQNQDSSFLINVRQEAIPV
ncbi:MAG: nucleotidyltransferase domain-containing protein [Planctomycetes bacterium]|nr:nucleotidyltransferase domain-containing protein [Planctomycetota bacterium]